VLSIALLLTLLAFYYVSQNVEAEARTRFDETTQATKAAIYRRLNANLAAMFGARALLRVSGSVERNEWDGYVRSIEPGSPLRKSRRLEGLQSLGFATYVIGSLLLVDIEVEPSAHIHPIKQRSQLFGRGHP
jgi:CHASE1-domain containing sensor protein